MRNTFHLHVMSVLRHPRKGVLHYLFVFAVCFRVNVVTIMIYMYDYLQKSKQVNILRNLYIYRGYDEVLPASFEGERNRVDNYRYFWFLIYIVNVCILRFIPLIHCILWNISIIAFHQSPLLPVSYLASFFLKINNVSLKWAIIPFIRLVNVDISV